jgi:hypothetical protein
MTKWLLGIVAVGIGSAAVAQVPYPNYSPPSGPPVSSYQLPQPGGMGGWQGFGVARPGPAVSPYLGLLLGRNLGVNYFLGTQTARQVFNPPVTGFGSSPFMVGPNSPLRTGFLPAAAGGTTDELFRKYPEIAPNTRIVQLPSSAHPVTFGSTGRYFPGANRPGFTAPRPTAPRTGSTIPPIR